MDSRKWASLDVPIRPTYVTRNPAWQWFEPDLLKKLVKTCNRLHRSGKECPITEDRLVLFIVWTLSSGNRKRKLLQCFLSNIDSWPLFSLTVLDHYFTYRVFVSLGLIWSSAFVFHPISLFDPPISPEDLWAPRNAWLGKLWLLNTLESVLERWWVEQEN